MIDPVHALEKPFDRCYWVLPRRVMAGAYPGAECDQEAKAKLSALLSAGIRAFVDLTEAGECNWAGAGLVPYEPLLAELGAQHRVPVHYRRFPIPDQGVTNRQRMAEIIDFMDDQIAAGHPVYVHCWGGKGRTGTAVGCWLIRQGMATVEDFVEVIAGLRRGDPGGGSSPENAAQKQFVRSFSRWEGP